MVERLNKGLIRLRLPHRRQLGVALVCGARREGGPRQLHHRRGARHTRREQQVHLPEGEGGNGVNAVSPNSGAA